MSEQVAHSEGSMYRLLHAHVCKDAGNGPIACLAPGVRSAAGFEARRTIDAVSLGLWPSRGMLLDGYEIKVSRSDWLRELRNPAKAEAFARLVDRLWLVVSDPEIVKDGELPDGWGLLALNGKGSQLRQVVKAQRLHEGKELPPGFGRSFLVPLLRPANSVPPDVLAELREEAERDVKWRLQGLQEQLEKLQEKVAAFEKGSGFKLTQWSHDGPDSAEERGRAFAAALAGEERLAQLRASAANIAKGAERIQRSALEIAA